jgi:hypothetical protein
MKIYLTIISFVFILSCHSPNEKLIYDYINFNNGTKEFRLTSDTNVRFFVRQNSKQINDTIWEFEFYWTRSDSLPFNKSIERYTPNGVELLEHSFYGYDSITKKVVEINANITGKKKFSFSDPDNVFEFEYKPEFTRTGIIKINATYNFDFVKIDSFENDGADFLVLNLKSKINMEHFEHQSDTTFYTKGLAVYKKNKGLIYYQKSGRNGKLLAFKLKE